MVAYAAFSLMYMKHKSAFSWFVHVLLATIYLLEFVQMWPQLIINHKLKTVDTLPLSAFCYRFLTTFIDDLFALVIPMPLLTRLGTFRDDIVFLVLCWQWWAYPKRKQATEDGKKGGPAGKDLVAATAEKAGDEGTTPDAAHSDGGRRDEKSGL
ncbi:hypothetical protein EV182_006493 [Spiromyces aspiralis]|uniref:Uncharacterized protein n=1 Tax=Spiromyces aspiralis TaxID=68401 RepID=A0ACC1HBZ6_9FUNG|nr:hypothetical protein EV182_006493 [Spiromyces aspiralis]